MRFDEAYGSWQRGHLTQAEAGRLLGMGERNFRRYVDRYRVEGETGLLDRRLTQASNRCAPVDEVLWLTDLYDNRYNGWNGGAISFTISLSLSDKPDTKNGLDLCT